MLPSVVLLLAGGLCIVLGGWAAGELVTGPLASVLVEGLDHPGMRWVASNRNGLVDVSMRAITHLGDRLVVVAILGAISAVAAARRSVRWTGFFLASTFGALLLSGTIKQLVDRPRPDLDRLIEIGGLSFPSGHATAAAICYGAVAIGALAVRSRPRIVIAALCISMAVVVAASRVWLGVHYPTDVMAGLVIGSAWVGLCYLAFLREGGVKPGVYPA